MNTSVRSITRRKPVTAVIGCMSSRVTAEFLEAPRDHDCLVNCMVEYFWLQVCFCGVENQLHDITRLRYMYKHNT